MPQKAEHMPLPVCLASAAADVLAGEAGSAARGSKTQQQQQQQQQGGSSWDASVSSGLVGKPVWLCCGQLVVDCLGYLPADPVAPTAAAASTAEAAPAAAAGAMVVASHGVLAVGNNAHVQEPAGELEDSLLSCMAVCCLGGWWG